MLFPRRCAFDATDKLVLNVCEARVSPVLLLNPRLPPNPPAEEFTMPSADSGMAKPAAPPIPLKVPEMSFAVRSNMRLCPLDGPPVLKSIPSRTNLWFPPAVLPARFRLTIPVPLKFVASLNFLPSCWVT